MSLVNVQIKRLDPMVELPSYAYAGDAGLDLRANETVDIPPHERVLISTGLAIAIPDALPASCSRVAAWRSRGVFPSQIRLGSSMRIIVASSR